MNKEPQPRWLNDEQQHIWRAYLMASSQLNAKLNAALRPLDLDLSEYEVLVSLSEAEGRHMRMSDLAERVHQSRSRLTHTVTRMENAGLVERRQAKSDRRGITAHLTEKGWDVLVKAAPTHVESVREYFVDVIDPADYAAMGRALKAVMAVTA